MRSSYTLERISQMRGKDVRSTAGEKIGSVDEVFYDETTRDPEWIGLGTGFLGMKHVVVPVETASIEGDEIRVPYSKDQVKNEPGFEERQGVLTPETESDLCNYFGLTSHPVTPHTVRRYDLRHRGDIGM